MAKNGVRPNLGVVPKLARLPCDMSNGSDPAAPVPLAAGVEAATKRVGKGKVSHTRARCAKQKNPPWRQTACSHTHTKKKKKYQCRLHHRHRHRHRRRHRSWHSWPGGFCAVGPPWRRRRSFLTIPSTNIWGGWQMTMIFFRTQSPIGLTPTTPCHNRLIAHHLDIRHKAHRLSSGEKRKKEWIAAHSDSPILKIR